MRTNNNTKGKRSLLELDLARSVLLHSYMINGVLQVNGHIFIEKIV